MSHSTTSRYVTVFEVSDAIVRYIRSLMMFGFVGATSVFALVIVHVPSLLPDTVIVDVSLAGPSSPYFDTRMNVYTRVTAFADVPPAVAIAGVVPNVGGGRPTGWPGVPASTSAIVVMVNLIPSVSRAGCTHC